MCVPLSFKHWCTITFRPTCRLMHMQYWPVFIYIYTSSVFVDLYSAINKNHFSKSWSFILFIFFFQWKFFFKNGKLVLEREKRHNIWSDYVYNVLDFTLNPSDIQTAKENVTNWPDHISCCSMREIMIILTLFLKSTKYLLYIIHQYSTSNWGCEAISRVIPLDFIPVTSEK